MKKYLLCLAALLAISLCSYSQLAVNHYGEVIIGANSSSVSATDSTSALVVNKKCNQRPDTVYGIKSKITMPYISGDNSSCIGISGGTEFSNPSFGLAKRMIGVHGYSSKSSRTASNFCVGIVGTTSGGVGIYGRSSNTLPATLSLSSAMAGYFDGPVKVAGTLTANTVSSSDARLKTSVSSLEQKKTQDIIMQLNPVSYYYKTPAKAAGEDNVNEDTLEGNDQIYSKQHYGLIAQELQAVLPNLVYDGGDTYLAINYTELIPLLIQQIQYLTDKVSNLEQSLSPEKSMAHAPARNSMANVQATLYQNNPNPYSAETVITYILPASIQDATIYVYDMNGLQLNQYALLERGEGKLVLSASEYEAGMYLYSLMADGQLIDTKRMILTK